MDHDEMRAAMKRATEPQVVIHSDPDGRWVLWQADCRTILSRLPDNCVDAIVTDPPYFLGFMGKEWDSADNVASTPELWREALRVLKPGGHLLAFGGSRTYHRLACAVEDAGFEIRDQIMWVYGSGFPKSLDVSKAIDKQAGAPVKVGKAFKVAGEYGGRDLRDPEAQGVSRDEMRHTAVTDAAKQWQGWGTALKPAHEPIVVARKPLEGTVAANVLKWGTGALNIDGTRVGTDDALPAPGGNHVTDNQVYGRGLGVSSGRSAELAGRWPANFIHDGSDEVLALFPAQAGSNSMKSGPKSRDGFLSGIGNNTHHDTRATGGSAARFFYCAKASKAERNAGLGHLPKKTTEHKLSENDTHGRAIKDTRTAQPSANHHPTVKPIALMRYLIRLVTPPGGVVLDPFAGSGTTMVAALMEGAQPWGCEMTADYVPIILGRVGWALDEVESRIEGTL